MGYALNKEKTGFRSVASEKDLQKGETFSLKVPELKRDVISDVTSQIQRLLDEQAQKMGYDSLLSAVSYLNDPNPQFAADATKLLAWRSACWTFAVNAKKENKPIDILKSLPKYEV